MNYLLKTLTIIAGLLFVGATAVDAQKGQGNLTGMGQELVKPMIVELSGELVDIKTGPCEHTTGHAIIGTHLFIRDAATDRVVNIHMGAAYAVEEFVNDLTIGHRVNVRGFPTELLDIDNYIAVDLESDGSNLTLRDDNLRPVWAGRSNGFFQNKNRFNGRRGRNRL